MESKNSKVNPVNVLLGIMAIVGFMVAAYFYFEDKKNKKRILELEQDNLKLIVESIKANNNISDEIKKQIIKLIEQFKNIDERISIELVQALQLLQIGQIENAIEDLVKIIEHLLTVHYAKNESFKKWAKKEKKKHDLHCMLHYCCYLDKKLTQIELQFFIAIKKIRDKEDHEIDLKIDSYLNASGLIVAIGGIMKMATIVYPEKGLMKSA